MRAVVVRQWTKPEDLKVESVPVVDPGPGQVRIAIHAAGLNFADTLMVQGKYQEKPPFPFSPGLEAAGEVEAAGEGVTDLKEGDRVMALTGHGGFAERCVVDAVRVLKIPASMGYVDAAAFPVAYGTSHVALRHRGHLCQDETLVVHGAAGGVGLTAVQIGKVIGARVIGTARGQEKLAIAQANGAEETIDYSEEDVRQRVLDITDGKGANVIYDPVGGDMFDISLRCIAWEGRLLVIGFATGRIPQAPANYLLLKNAAAVGVFWGAYMKKDPSVIVRSFEELMGWYDEGLLSPHISATFDLEETPAAMEMLLARKSTGKIVVTTGITAHG
ncbi:MAG: NADPH:quinone oxidoreductase family protein [Rhodospirillaceae bacterium]|nr:NADPH:quinone oxidoreductase family protein [Rhodospirillaceae bacterium]